LFFHSPGHLTLKGEKRKDHRTKGGEGRQDGKKKAGVECNGTHGPIQYRGDGENVLFAHNRKGSSLKRGGGEKVPYLCYGGGNEGKAEKPEEWLENTRAL